VCFERRGWWCCREPSIMTLNPDGLEILLGDKFKYPYNNTVPFSCSYEDKYNRNPRRLLKSAAHFGALLQERARSQVPTEMQEIPPEMQEIFATFVQFSDDSLTPEQLPSLIRYFRPDSIKSRTILPPQILDGNNEEITKNMARDLRLHHQVIVIHHVDQNCWIIFLILTSQHTVDIYTIGDVKQNRMHQLLQKIILTCEEVLTDFRPSICLRLQIPKTYKVDPALLAFTLSYSIHRHEPYLDLTFDQILQQKCVVLRSLIASHDKWFGRFHLKDTTDSSHPFIVYGENEQDDLDELIAAGWSVIDVLGDGNCGYYAFIIGLENHGNYSYSVRNRNPTYQPMSANLAWQDKILQLRRRMQQQSRLLLRTEYPVHGRNQRFWEYTWVFCGSEEDFDRLTEAFASDDIEDQDYFNGSYGIPQTEDESDEAKNLREFYHMDPTWAPHVFSFMFNMRVIVYTRQSSCNKNNRVTRMWSTTIFDYNSPVEERVVQHPHLHRITDSEFRRIPTVELLFICGVGKDHEQLIGHCQYLRRVVFADVPTFPDPSSKSLRQYLKPTKRKKKSTAGGKGRQPNKQPRQKVRRPAQAERSATTTSPTRVQIDLPSTPPAPQSPSTPPALDPPSTPPAPQSPSTPPALDPPPSTPPAPRSPVTTSIHASIGRKSFHIPAPGKSNKLIPVKKVRRTKSWFNDKRQTNRRLTMQYKESQLKDKTATKLRLDPVTMDFYKRDWDETSGTLGPAVMVEDIEMYDEFLVQSAMRFEGEWMGPSIGDASSNGTAPVELCSSVPTIYQQHKSPFCITYSLASALFYCGFHEQARILAQQATSFAGMDFDDAIVKLRGLMPHLVPEIGLATVYGVATSRHNRFRREMTWEQLFRDITPYPTVIIPISNQGIATHAFCVVDDLIFDSITPMALKLQQQSVDWVFNDAEMHIFVALRFNTKISQKGQKIKEKYRRKVTYHW